jgi:glycosyltransferase involved in cell wall biosynthesis
MRIWLVNPYGPIPGEGWRDYRFTLLGRVLAARGHDVTWWTANFAHHFKSFRSKSWEDRLDSPNFTIRLVPTSGYSRNIGLARVAFEVNYVQNLLRRSKGMSAPDLIIGVDPPQTAGWASRSLAKRHGAKLLIDVFDLWPELFELALPQALRKFSGTIFAPLYMMRKSSYRSADAITALCNFYLHKARAESGRLNQPVGVFYNGIDVSVFRQTMSAVRDKDAIRADFGVRSNALIAVYAGSLGPNYDISTLLATARQLQQREANVQLIVAGSGPLENEVRNVTESIGVQWIRYLGKVTPDRLMSLYSVCDVGLCAYGPFSNVGMPDKFYDYTSAGLFILNSLTGELSELILREGIGRNYRAGDPQNLTEILVGLSKKPKLTGAMKSSSFNVANEYDSRVQYGAMADFIEANLR